MALKSGLKLTLMWRYSKMERFKRYQEAVSNVPTEWLIDCAASPSDNMRQAEVNLILLEIVRRIKDAEVI